MNRVSLWWSADVCRHLELKQYAEALQQYDLGRGILTELGVTDTSEMAALYINIGTALKELGQLDEVRAHGSITVHGLTHPYDSLIPTHMQ